VRIVAIRPERATVELSMAEFGLLMNALWQDLGYQAPRRGPLEEDLRTGDDALQEDLQAVISEMDAAADGLPGLWRSGYSRLNR
jgi:hypothetical protein